MHGKQRYRQTEHHRLLEALLWSEQGSHHMLRYGRYPHTSIDSQSKMKRRTRRRHQALHVGNGHQDHCSVPRPSGTHGTPACRQTCRHSCRHSWRPMSLRSPDTRCSCFDQHTPSGTCCRRSETRRRPSYLSCSHDSRGCLGSRTHVPMPSSPHHQVTWRTAQPTLAVQ